MLVKCPLPVKVNRRRLERGKTQKLLYLRRKTFRLEAISSCTPQYLQPPYIFFMVFSSHIFLFYFLPLSLLFYYSMPKRGRNLLLTGVSYIFYGWSNPLFTLLMFYSTLIDYCCGLVIGLARDDQQRRRKIALLVSIAGNLSLLGFFKYTGFALENYNRLFATLGVDGFDPVPVLSFLLPLGISFYTFQSMSYTIDVYRKDGECVRNFLDFCCFVSMFPQLVAGPIIRF